MLYFLIGILFLGQSALGKCPASNLQIEALGSCIKVKTFKSTKLSNSPVLIIVIHGDSPFVKPKYHYDFAQRIAKSENNLISIGLLRPGFTDHEGRRSDGVRGSSVGDNYDDKRVKSIAAAMSNLKKRHKAKTIIAIGHSGGAAIVGKVLALHPKLVDMGILVSCPCDINAWRADMLKKTGNEAFRGNIEISSPLDLVNRVPENAQIKIIVGKTDTTTRPDLSKRYYQNLIKSGGVDAKLFQVPGGHNILHSDRVFKIIKKEIKKYSERKTF